MAGIPLPKIEISIKFKDKKYADLIKVQSSEESADVFRMLFNDGTIQYQEEFIMICLNQANKVIAYYKVSSGGMTGTVADIRTIALIAVNTCATSVIVAHNHPSGNLTPSNADKQLTQKLKSGLELLTIKLLDHLIITEEGYISFSDEGIL